MNSSSTAITSYKDLLVWQRGMDLVEAIYQITTKLPPLNNGGCCRKCDVRRFQFRRISRKDTPGKRQESTGIIFLLPERLCWNSKRMFYYASDSVTFLYLTANRY